MLNKLKGMVGLLAMLMSCTGFALPNVEHWQLSNGANVYFVPTTGLPILDVQLMFDAGSAHDGSQLGQAALTSALLDESAGGLTAQQVAENIESVGAQLSTSASRDFSSITYRSLTDEKVLATAWPVFINVVNSPDFSSTDFNRLKQRILLSIKQREESPGTLAQLALYEQIYEGHPYKNPIQGTEKTVTELNVEDVRRYYQQYYVGKNLTVVMVGGVTRQAAEKLVNDLVGKLKTGVKAAQIPAVLDRSEALQLHKDYPSQQTHLLYATPVLKHNDPDYFALHVGNHILGGSGFSSRIVKEIREERGLAYSAYSYFNAMRQKGPFLLGLQTKNERVAEASTALKETLKTFITEGPTEEELLASKKNIRGGFALKLDSNKKLMSVISGIVVSGRSLDYLNTYLQNINGVTLDSIKDAFQRRVDMEKMVMVTVGNSDIKK